MTSETRVLRPFESVSALEEFIGSITLDVGGEEVEPDARITLDESLYRHVSVAVRLPHRGRGLTEALIAIDEGLMGIGLDGDQVLFVVNLYSSFLKISEYVHRSRLSDLMSEDGLISLTDEGPRPTPLRTAHSGCRVEVAAVLATQLEPQVGRPWRRGTWLARSRFTISCDVDYAGFTARPMDLEQKATLGLPQGATRYVALPDDVDPIGDTVTPDVVELWVDAELLATMSARPTAPVSAALQRQLFCDVFSVVTTAARTRAEFDDLSWSDVSSSLLGLLIRGLVGREKNDDERKRDERCAELLNLLKDDHGRFLSYVEDRAGTTAAFTRALGD